jgi:hypothetical protein
MDNSYFGGGAVMDMLILDDLNRQRECDDIIGFIVAHTDLTLADCARLSENELGEIVDNICEALS